MGQYYVIANVDKKECIRPRDWGNGLKLTEWAWNRNKMVLGMMKLMCDRWCGDRVYVVGDYADQFENNIWSDAYTEAIEEFPSKGLSLFSIAYSRIFLLIRSAQNLPIPLRAFRLAAQSC